jgi:hypothetical protein
MAIAEIIKIELNNNNPDVLSELDVDGLVVLVEPLSKTGPLSESLRCLDWTLNHQLRRALEKMGDLPVFIPSMNKIKAPYVVLCSSMTGKKLLEQNCQAMHLKSLALVPGSGKIPSTWIHWTLPEINKIYFCEENGELRGQKI